MLHDLASPAVPLRVVGKVNLVLETVDVVQVQFVFPLIGYPEILEEKVESYQCR